MFITSGTGNVLPLINSSSMLTCCGVFADGGAYDHFSEHRQVF